MSAENFQPKETPLRTFADEATTLYLFLLTCSAPALISTIINTNLGQIALAAGGTATITSFIAGRIMNRHEDNHPNKPLATQNPEPITIAQLKPTRIAA